MFIESEELEAAVEDDVCSLKVAMEDKKYKQDLLDILGQPDYNTKLEIISKLAIKEESEGRFKPEVDEVDKRTPEQKGSTQLHNGYSIQCGLRGSKLSGGQKQRVAVATALVGNPKLLFLDEPTTGLDPQSRRDLWRIITEFREAGGTVLLTTHYMDEAERLCDRVAIFDRGKILAIDSPQKLIADLGAEHMVVFTVSGSTEPADDFGTGLPGVIGVRRESEHRCLSVREPHIAIPSLLALINQQGLQLTSLTTRQATLEDVFVHYAGHGLNDESEGARR